MHAAKPFYDQIGWQITEGKFFADSLKFEDLRPLVHLYIHRCHLCLGQFIQPTRQILLGWRQVRFNTMNVCLIQKAMNAALVLIFQCLLCNKLKNELGKKKASLCFGLLQICRLKPVRAMISFFAYRLSYFS